MHPEVCYIELLNEIFLFGHVTEKLFVRFFFNCQQPRTIHIAVINPERQSVIYIYIYISSLLRKRNFNLELPHCLLGIIAEDFGTISCLRQLAQG